MVNEMDFDTARNATEEMFEGDEITQVPAESTEGAIEGTVSPEESDTVNEIETQSENTVLDDAVQTAELAAQVAADRDTELKNLLDELNMQKQRNAALQSTIDELSKSNEQQIVEEALEPPVLDIGSLLYADEETVRRAQADYAAKMAEYNRTQIMKELSPFVNQAKEGLYEKEKRETVQTLSQLPELNDMESMLPQIENIIKNNKVLSSSDIELDEKLVTAYAIAKGVEAMNAPAPEPPKDPSPEELMELYDKNPAFKELIEKRRLEEIKHSQQVPPFSASSGAVNAALNIKEKPKTFEEASRRTEEMFRG